MKNNTIYLLIGFISCVVLGFLLWHGSTPNEIIKTDTVFTTRTDTLWKDTTIYQDKLIPKYITKVKTDTLYKENGDTVQLVTESKTFEKSIISDKDTADLKIYTSGINTSLDSLKMRLKTHTEVITNTVEVTKYVDKKKTFLDRFHIGLQVGYGYGFEYKGLEPYAGIGGSFDL